MNHGMRRLYSEIEDSGMGFQEEEVTFLSTLPSSLDDTIADTIPHDHIDSDPIQPQLSQNNTQNVDTNPFQSPPKREDAYIDESWREKYALLLEYGAQHGTYNVPQKYKCQSVSNGTEFALGKWVAGLREFKKKGTLLPHRYELLQKLADSGKFDWEPSSEENRKWNLRFEALVKYAHETGNCDMPRTIETKLSDGSTCRLYTWLSHELFLRKKHKLKADRENLIQTQLVDPGYLKWDRKQDADELQWETKYQCLLAYGRTHNGCYNVPSSYKCLDSSGREVKLGSWLSVQRVEKRKNGLRPDRVAKLNALTEHGFLWDVNYFHENRTSNWDRKYEALLKYEKEYGTCNVPDSFKVYHIDGKATKLGRWLGKQRRAKRLGKLIPQREQLLQKLVDEKRLLWELSSAEFNTQAWEEKFAILNAYGNIQGNCELPRNAIIVSTNEHGRVKELRLGEWLLLQKTAKKYGKLKPEREEKLQALVNQGKLSWDLEGPESRYFVYPRDRQEEYPQTSSNDYHHSDAYNNIPNSDTAHIHDGQHGHQASGQEINSFQYTYPTHQISSDHSLEQIEPRVFSGNAEQPTTAAVFREPNAQETAEAMQNIYASLTYRVANPKEFENVPYKDSDNDDNSSDSDSESEEYLPRNTNEGEITEQVSSHAHESHFSGFDPNMPVHVVYGAQTADPANMLAHNSTISNSTTYSNVPIYQPSSFGFIPQYSYAQEPTVSNAIDFQPENEDDNGMVEFVASSAYTASGKRRAIRRKPKSST